MHRLEVIASRRLRRQDGFGLVELLIAMTVLVIGIMGIVAAFSAGAVSLQRASRISNAATLADAQMEGYRALPYSDIKLDNTDSDGGGPDTGIPTSGLYTSDQACGGACGAASQEIGGSATCAVLPRYDAAAHAACPSRMQVAADGITYRVDVYIKPACALSAAPPCTSSRTIKNVAITVREGTTDRVLFRESSTFDAATGGE